jgi:xanthine dehydrogenase accessory factor
MEALYEEILRIQRAGEQAALVTVIEALGSTPQGLGAKMLVYPDGHTLGTIGGGCMEAEVLDQARRAIEARQPSKLKVRLAPDPVSGRDAICGGVVELFIEPIRCRPRVVILGAGHIGAALAPLVRIAGYRVAVADDRVRYANRERFPEVEELIVDDFAAAIKRLALGPTDYVVIVTRGHEFDKECLALALQSPAAYVGMIGSKTKVAKSLKALRQEQPPEARLARLFAPIGLDLGAVSPGEIAVSILAEIIALEHDRDLARLSSLSRRAPAGSA